MTSENDENSRLENILFNTGCIIALGSALYGNSINEDIAAERFSYCMPVALIGAAMMYATAAGLFHGRDSPREESKLKSKSQGDSK